ncbi:MAG TPA: cyclic pyranopterin monophosphate synthase MoaC [Capsulimonadaceae bacterium]|jgi:cyclic pyranopterin phosphate synthase
MSLTHIDEHGHARMVDVSAKAATRREAIAEAWVHMAPATRAAIKENALAKGDALGVARVAAIMAAKRVDDLIPLCHSLPLAEVRVEFEFRDDGLRIETTAVTVAQTGVEMEALTAASVAALTVYDMAKAIDKRMVIDGIKLLRKTGGKSGDFQWDRSE